LLGLTPAGTAAFAHEEEDMLEPAKPVIDARATPAAPRIAARAISVWVSISGLRNRFTVLN
jgi:hypothetical protein